MKMWINSCGNVKRGMWIVDWMMWKVKKMQAKMWKLYTLVKCEYMKYKIFTVLVKDVKLANSILKNFYYWCLTDSQNLEHFNMATWTMKSDHCSCKDLSKVPFLQLSSKEMLTFTTHHRCLFVHHRTHTKQTHTHRIKTIYSRVTDLSFFESSSLLSTEIGLLKVSLVVELQLIPMYSVLGETCKKYGFMTNTALFSGNLKAH